MLVQRRKGWANINPASGDRQGRIQGGAQGARAHPLNFHSGNFQTISFYIQLIHQCTTCWFQPPPHLNIYPFRFKGLVYGMHHWRH